MDTTTVVICTLIAAGIIILGMFSTYRVGVKWGTYKVQNRAIKLGFATRDSGWFRWYNGLYLVTYDKTKKRK